VFNLAVVLRESAAATPGKPVAVWDGGRLSYAELDERSDRVAVALAGLGVARGDRIALQLPNIAPFLVAHFGILKAGPVVVPLNVLLKTQEVAFQLGNSSAKALMTWAGVADDATAGAAQAGVDDVFVVGEILEGLHARRFDELLAAPTSLRPMAVTDADDTAVIVYTSGTTGRPKGAELTHFQLYMNADIPGRLFAVEAGDVVLTALPLFHVFGLSSILDIAVRFGATLSLIPRFTPDAVLTAIARDRATIFEGVPTMFVALLEAPGPDRYDVSSLRIAISGGATIPPQVLNAFEERFGLTVHEGYGMTETASTTTSSGSVEDRRPYSVGKPVWGTECQIRDGDDRSLPSGPDHIGEIVTRGFHTMKGYLDDPEATAAVFTDGWLRTGDLGYRDEDGFHFVVGRKKELIIRGGFNVYPREVEEALHEHPAVAEVAVVGIPDQRLGEEVLAFVTLVSGVGATAAELITYCRDRLAGYKYPRMIEFRTDLPKSATGKILKLELRARLLADRAASPVDDPDRMRPSPCSS
jgi:long-chain acyl-CoA synthetase